MKLTTRTTQNLVVFILFCTTLKDILLHIGMYNISYICTYNVYSYVRTCMYSIYMYICGCLIKIHVQLYIRT